MPALKHGLALALFMVAPSASADVPAPPRATGPWDAGVRAGYASAFTTGLSSLGLGLGGAAAYTFPWRLRLEAVVVWSAGDTDAARNDTITYRSSYASLRGTLGAAYEIPIGPVRLRPGIQTGFTFIYGSTKVGPAETRDGEPRFLVGPALSAIVRVDRFDLGVATEAFFLPSWVAAPSAGVYGVTSVRF